jgi:hypothetical protein
MLFKTKLVHWMKWGQLRMILLALLVSGLPLPAQTRVDLRKQSRNSDASRLPDVTFAGNKAVVCARCGVDIATARLLNSVHQYSTPVEMTVLGGANTASSVKFYVDASLNLRAQYDSSILTSVTFGVGLLPDTLGTSFPEVSLPLYSCTVSSLTWNSCTDLRAIGSWIPSSGNGSCSITATTSGWDFDCPGQGLTNVTYTKELRAAGCDWAGNAYPRDISVKASANPGAVCFNGIGALTLPDASSNVEMLFDTTVPPGISGTTDVQVDVFSSQAGAVSLTLAVVCRAADSANSNYQTFPVSYGNAEARIVTLSSTQTSRFFWGSKALPSCTAGEELHWQLTRSSSDANSGAVQVVRAVVMQRAN